jgi:hypothetical protein
MLLVASIRSSVETEATEIEEIEETEAARAYHASASSSRIRPVYWCLHVAHFHHRSPDDAAAAAARHATCAAPQSPRHAHPARITVI